MKKRILWIYLAIPFMASGLNIYGQNTLPVDPKLRYGKLDNGMTYYIRPNQKPENRASFYIVQNVGAILETDEQNGLAHFLEHMAFNGTKHFPGKGIIDYLEKNGLAFGRNINAYTSLDETVYNLSNVPTMREGLIDSCLLILHDWSNYISLLEKDIDDERGVIAEEWRQGRNAQSRMMKKLRPEIFKGSQYAKRDVIGDINVIENFDYETIRKFYNDWYRTDQQAIIVVGDVDPDEIEAKIVERFAKIPPLENPRERTIYGIPDNKKPICGIATDPEAGSISVSLLIKHDAKTVDQKNEQYILETFKQNLYSQMLNNRFAELTQQKNPPYVNASALYTNLTRTKDVYALSVVAKPNEVLKAFEAALTINEQLIRHGFTEGELKRAKLSLLSGIESSYQERDKRYNESFVNDLKQHFLIGEPIPGIEYFYQFANKTIPGIKLQDMNDLAQDFYTQNNQIIMINAPETEKDNLPDEQTCLDLLNNIRLKDISPYEDKTNEDPLISESIIPGKTVEEKWLDSFNAQQWTLSNGAKIIVKETDFKKDQILFKAFSKGGQSKLEKEDLPAASLLPQMMSLYGIGAFDQISLQKKLSGKVLSISPYLSELQEGFQGSVRPKDFETFLQLIHLYFTNPRFDANAHDGFLNRISGIIDNLRNNPDQVLSDSINQIVSNYNPRVFSLDREILSKVSIDRMEKIYKDRFTDASDFTFVFTGNIHAESAQEMIEKYIGGIASSKRAENWVNRKVTPPETDIKKTIPIKMKDAKSTVFIYMHNDYDYSPENNLKASILNGILDIVYTQRIREDEGGTYGVSTSLSTTHFPEEKITLNIAFNTHPDKVETLLPIVYEEIDKMIEEGPKAEDLDKTIKNLRKQRQENLKQNNYWQSLIIKYETHQVNSLLPENFELLLDQITPESIKHFAKQYLENMKKIEIISEQKE